MAKLTLIKKITTKEVVNSFNLIMNVLFGGKTPEIYDENKVYNKGDCVIVEENGVYKLYTIMKDGVTGPFDINNVQEIVFTDLFEDSSVLTQNNTELQSIHEALSDDLATIVYELAGLIDSRLALKVLYRENFKNSDFINITTGLHIPGCVQAIPGLGLDFKLTEPVQLTTKPRTFKLKHVVELSGINTLGCSITFNALDENPYWFSANDALLSSDFFEIPQFEKDDDKPYALDIQLYGDCSDDSSIKISDLMVVFI